MSAAKIKPLAAELFLNAANDKVFIQEIIRPPEFIGKWWLPDLVDTRHLPDDNFLLLSDFRFGTPDGKTYVIKAGFIYDKASVPWIVWWYIPRDDKDIERAALIHDLLYAIQRLGHWLTRSYVDQLFHDVMEQDGMRYDKRKLAYWGVRTGGWRYFNPRAHELGNTHYIEQS